MLIQQNSNLEKEKNEHMRKSQQSSIELLKEKN
jgi:hypothetical protein